MKNVPYFALHVICFDSEVGIICALAEPLGAISIQLRPVLLHLLLLCKCLRPEVNKAIPCQELFMLHALRLPRRAHAYLNAPKTHELGCVAGSCSPVSRLEPSTRRLQRSARCCRRHMQKVRQLSYHCLFAHEVLLLLLLPFIPGQPLCSEGCNTSSMPFLRMEAGVHPKFSCDAEAVINGAGKYKSIEIRLDPSHNIELACICTCSKVWLAIFISMALPLSRLVLLVLPHM